MKHAKDSIELQGEECWADLYSDDAEATIKFLHHTLGVEAVHGSKESDMNYKMIKAKEGSYPYAGVMQIEEKHRKKGLKPHTTMYVTVKDYDEMHKKFIKDGAKPILENMLVEDMKLKYGIYAIPGGLELGIAQFNIKS